MRKIVYPTLAKPNLLRGIPRDFILIAMMLSTPLWTITQNIFSAFLAFVVLIAFGWVMAKFDPDFVEVNRAKHEWIKPNFGFGGKKGNEYQS